MVLRKGCASCMPYQEETQARGPTNKCSRNSRIRCRGNRARGGAQIIWERLAQRCAGCIAGTLRAPPASIAIDLNRRALHSGIVNFPSCKNRGLRFLVTTENDTRSRLRRTAWEHAGFAHVSFWTACELRPCQHRRKILQRLFGLRPCGHLPPGWVVSF